MAPIGLWMLGWVWTQGFAAEPPAWIHVDRRARVVYLMDATGQVLHQESVGIGRGGLREKTAMADLVTPTGRFVVDVILEPSGEFVSVSDGIRQKYAESDIYGPLVKDSAGLVALFTNMSGLDFDGDGAPDGAYGPAYIGLDGPGSGPKMRGYKGTPYWYSIALHGTPDPANVGQANSGGCIHLTDALLHRWIRGGFVQIGTVVEIADSPPPR